MMKKILLAFSALLFVFPFAYAEKAYSDVDEGDSHYVAIQYLSLDEVGVFQGYSDGTFRPEEEINRAELMKVLVESVYGTPDDEIYANCYPDVGEEWYAKYICYATEQGWVEGYPDGSFLPANTVLKVEAVKMMLNAHGFSDELPEEVLEEIYIDTDNTQWYMPYIYLAKQYNLLEEIGAYYEPSAEIDRAGVAEVLFRIYVVLYSGLDSYTDEAKSVLLDAYGLSDLISGDDVPADAVLGTLATTNSVGRTGSYYLPDGYNLEEMPLLILYHGTDGDGMQILSSFIDLAEEHGFIIIAPDSRISPEGNYTWEVGSSAGEVTEDYTHMTNCINEVLAMSGVSIDENFVMAAGFSGGASSAPYYATNTDWFTNFAILHGGVFVTGLGDNVVPGWLSTGEDDTLRTPEMLEGYVSSLESFGYSDLTYNVYPGGHELMDQELEELVGWWLGE